VKVRLSLVFYTKQIQYFGLEKDNKVNYKFMFEEFEVNEKIILRHRKEIFYIIMLEIIKIAI
jgi:hypothetical protein